MLFHLRTLQATFLLFGFRLFNTIVVAIAAEHHADALDARLPLGPALH